MRTASTHDRLYRTGLRLVRFMLRLLTRTTRTGLGHIPVSGPVIVAGNHISTFDPVVLAASVAAAGRRPRAMATAGLFSAPVLGWLLLRCGLIPVHRRSANPAAALAPAAAALNAGQVVMLYPEGKISTDPDLWPLPPKTGVVRLALLTGAPVVPVAQWGAHRVIPRGSSPVAALTGLARRPHIQVEAGAPIDLRAALGVTDPAAATAEQVRAGAALVMDAIEELLVGLRQQHRPDTCTPRAA